MSKKIIELFGIGSLGIIGLLLMIVYAALGTASGFAIPVAIYGYFAHSYFTFSMFVSDLITVTLWALAVEVVFMIIGIIRDL